MNYSAGESQTTIPISNSTPRILQREREDRKQRELETLEERKKMEKIEELIRRKQMEHKIDANPNVNQDTMSINNRDHQHTKAKKNISKQSKNKISKQSKNEKSDKKKYRANGQATSVSQQRNRPATKRAQQSGTDYNSNPYDTASNSTYPCKLNTKLESQNHFTFGPEQSSSIRNQHHSSHAIDSASQSSLDYSLDDTSSIPGGQYTTDTASIASNNTGNQSIFSYITRSSIESQELRSSSACQNRRISGLTDDDVSFNSKSVQSAEQIPSDEDLFSIGWAKALDGNTGTYYYFTLDRSQIVWENPFAAALGSGASPRGVHSSVNTSNGVRF